jgi:hypothetical protein
MSSLDTKPGLGLVLKAFHISIKPLKKRAEAKSPVMACFLVKSEN